MIQRLRNLSATSLRTAENLLSTFEQRPVRAARWVLRHAADFVDPPRNAIPQPGPERTREPTIESPAERATPSAEPPPAIDGAALKRALANDPAPLVLDVREPHETATGVIPGARLIPMREVLTAVGELRATQKTIVVYCAHGVRSVNVAQHLRDRGLDASTLSGGIGAWVETGGELVRP